MTNAKREAGRASSRLLRGRSPLLLCSNRREQGLTRYLRVREIRRVWVPVASANGPLQAYKVNQAIGEREDAHV